MDIKVFTIPSELKSVKWLKLPVNTYINKKKEDYDNSIVIRAGNSEPVFDKDGNQTEFKYVINKAENIAFNVKKDESCKKLSEVVNTPKIYTAGQRVTKSLFVVRPINHTYGEGFEVKRGPFKVKKGFYAKQFLKTHREYRMLYVANGGGQFMMLKRQTDNKKLLNEKYQCRSKWGYIQLEKIPQVFKKDTKKAFEALGLEFGAADCLFYKRKFYFLEVNSCPSVNDNVIASFMRNNFKKLIKEKYPEIKLNKQIRPIKLKKTNLEEIW